MNYFQYLNTTQYTIDDVTFTITNITDRARIAERLRQHTTSIYDYVIADEQRPDTVAQIVYGDVRYTWIVLLLNNIMSLYDWPLTNTEFTEYIIDKYGSIELANEGEFEHYFSVEGDEVDATTYGELGSRQGAILTPFEFEQRENEAKRKIKIISAKFLPQVEQSIKTLFK